MRKGSVFVYWRNLSIVAISLPAILISVVLVSQIVELNQESQLRQLQASATIKTEQLARDIESLVYQWQWSDVDSPWSNLSPYNQAILGQQSYTRFGELLHSQGVEPISLASRFPTWLASWNEKLGNKQSVSILLARDSDLTWLDKQADGRVLLVATNIVQEDQSHDGIKVMFLDFERILHGQQDPASQVVMVTRNQEALSEQPHLQEGTWQATNSNFKLFDQPLTLHFYQLQNVASSHMTRALISVILLVVAILIPTTVVTMLLARKLLKPLKSINYLVKQYAKGNFEATIPLTPFNELNNLKTLLEVMARKVSRAKADLEQRVQDRAMELELANAELLNVLESVEKMQKQAIASEKMSSLGRLVAGVAHEINTPLGVALTASTTVQSLVKGLENKKEQQALTRTDLRKYIDSTVESAELLVSNLTRAAELVHNFKEVAVDQSSEGLRRFALDSYLKEVFMAIKPRFKEYEFEIVTQVDSSIVLNSYPGAVAQIITNLVENSALHGFKPYQSHQISIRAESPDPSTVTIIYQDDGCGIAQGLQDRIFEPFFTTDRKRGGTGLGMHIVFNQITQKLGGTIEMVPSNIGVKFNITLAVDVTQQR